MYFKISGDIGGEPNVTMKKLNNESAMIRSGRLITGAAAIMISVFLAFGLADVVIIKSIGIGIAIAIAVDATVVRALMVPAIMRLLGRANWWAPSLLRRLQRRAGLVQTTVSPAA